MSKKNDKTTQIRQDDKGKEVHTTISVYDCVYCPFNTVRKGIAMFYMDCEHPDYMDVIKHAEEFKDLDFKGIPLVCPMKQGNITITLTKAVK